MYLEHWGLREKPFENTPDTRFFYFSPEHGEGFRRLAYAVREHKGCALLTGEYGCGKTILIRAVINSLEAEHYDLALINYPMFAEGEFFRELLTQYGQTAVSGTALDLYHQISQYAYENVSRNKYSLVVIDEAQLIAEPRVYEEIRLLLNLQMEDGFLIHFLLAGQPELRESIMQFPQLEQRISIKYHLHHMSFENTVEYIRYRLGVAGAAEDFFTADAYETIHKSSVGVARRINNLCDLCLLEGSYLGFKKIDKELAKRIL